MKQHIRIGTVAGATTVALALACQNGGLTAVPSPPPLITPGQASAFPPFAANDGRAVLAEAQGISNPLGVATLALDTSEAFAVSADPERGAIRIVNLAEGSARRLDVSVDARLGATVAGSQFAFVLAPGSSSIHKVQLNPPKLLAESKVCPAPEGITLSSDESQLFIACRGGELLTLDANSLETTRLVTLAPDLRDVAEFRDGLAVSRFRPSEVLLLDGAGTVVDSIRPEDTLGSSTVAWRMRVHDNSIFLLHQLSTLNEVGTTSLGYGQSCDSAIVIPVFSQIDVDDAAPGLGGSGPSSTIRTTSSVRLIGLAGVVDFAFEAPDQVAIIAPGNAWAPTPRTSLIHLSLPLPFAPEDDLQGCNPDANALGVNGNGNNMARAAPDGAVAGNPAEIGAAHREPPIAIASSRTGTAVLQLRQSAAVGREGAMVTTDPPGLERQGQRIFHMSTDASIACVSCHPGGGDDSHTWHFTGLGARRTQSLEGGISSRAPFHWDGEFQEIGSLMSDVFVGRMGATVMPSTAELGKFVSWLDGIRPSAPVPESNAESVARGAELFASEEVACATCHSGPAYSDGKLHDVGTGRAFITPHLTGIATRAPYMHDGCAPDLKARFGVCGGGDAHGVTSGLKTDQIDDLVAYLRTL